MCDIESDCIEVEAEYLDRKHAEAEEAMEQAMEEAEVMEAMSEEAEQQEYCEPLKDKGEVARVSRDGEVEYEYQWHLENQGRKISENDVVFPKKEVQSAVRFYKRYEDKPSLLENERPEIFEKVKSYTLSDTCYREELFNIAFKDAVEEE